MTIRYDRQSDSLSGICTGRSILFIAEQRAQARQTFTEKAVKKHPRHYLSDYGQGMFAGFNGDHNTAIKFLRQSIDKHPTYGLAHYNLATSYQKIHRVDLAIRHHHAAPKFATPEEHPVMSASQDCLDIVKKDLPEGFTIEEYLEDTNRFEQAFDLLHNDKYQQAAELFKIVAANQPQHVQARGNLGICYLMIRDYEQSRRCLEQVLALDPDYEPAKKNLEILNSIESGLLEKPLGMNKVYHYADKLKES